MNLRVSVDTSLPGIRGILAACRGDALDAPEFDDMRNQWSVRYESSTRRRFDQFGRGGGDWPALALSTIEARRGPARGRGGKGGGTARSGARTSLARDTARGGVLVGTGRTITILSDTGLLRNALQLGATGNFSGSTPKGIEFGFDNVPHAGTIAETASRKARTLFAEAGRGGGSEKSYSRLRKQASAARGEAVKAERRARGRSAATIAQIAGWHNTGTPRMPQRLILAPPDVTTARGMSNDFTRAVLAIGRRSALAAGRRA